MNKPKVYILTAALASWIAVDAYEVIRTLIKVARNK